MLIAESPWVWHTRLQDQNWPSSQQAGQEKGSCIGPVKSPAQRSKGSATQNLTCCTGTALSWPPTPAIASAGLDHQCPGAHETGQGSGPCRCFLEILFVEMESGGRCVAKFYREISQGLRKCWRSTVENTCRFMEVLNGLPLNRGHRWNFVRCGLTYAWVLVVIGQISEYLSPVWPREMRSDLHNQQ